VSRKKLKPKKLPIVKKRVEKTIWRRLEKFEKKYGYDAIRYVINKFINFRRLQISAKKEIERLNEELAEQMRKLK